MNVAARLLSRRSMRERRVESQAYGSAPRTWGKKTALIAGLTLAGIQAPFILEGAVATLAFET